MGADTLHPFPVFSGLSIRPLAASAGVLRGSCAPSKSEYQPSRRASSTFAFSDDEWYYPLQAADLLSYASCNELKKGSNAWEDSNVFSDLLKDEDPTYGKRYLSELWSDDEEDSKALMEAIIRETVQFQEGVK